jgi:hypothetical protein
MSEDRQTSSRLQRVPANQNNTPASSFQDESNKNRFISPAIIGEFISFDQCPRYFKHRAEEIEQSWYYEGDQFSEAFEALDLLLSKTGHEFEQEVVTTLQTESGRFEDLERAADDFKPDHDVLIDVVKKAIAADSEPATPTLLFQPSVTGQIGVWGVGGDADIVLVWTTATGAHIRVLDAKSTSEQKPYHQIQAATYVDLIEQQLAAATAIDETLVTTDAGIVARDADMRQATREAVPSFETQSRISDIRRLLGEDGRLIELAETEFNAENGTPSYQLNQKCAQCPYNEACVSDAFEDGHVRLLGLSITQQEILAEHGIESIAELAQLCARPDDDIDDRPTEGSPWFPTSYPEAHRTTSTYRKLAETNGIGELLPQLVYHAQALRDSFDPTDQGIAAWPQSWIPGTGRCSLPEDNPRTDTALAPNWQNGSMVRVYLNVQTDHLRDRILQLSARVSATASGVDSKRFSILADESPGAATSPDPAERELLEQFIAEVYGAIRDVADGLNLERIEQSSPPLHFYLYTGQERSALTEAFDRHDRPLINSFQSTLEGHTDSGEQMVSLLRPEISNHIALRTPSPGLIHAYDELWPPDSEYQKPRSVDAWSYTPPSDTEPVHLREAFSHRLFNVGVNCTRRGDAGIEVEPTKPNQIDGVKTKVRFGAQIPLGYLLVAAGEIDHNWIENLEDFDPDSFEIARYRYHDRQTEATPIRRCDVEAIGRHLCDAIEHVERALIARDLTMAKEPYPLSELETDRFETPSLAAGSRRYLKMEHAAAREEEYAHYRQFPAQRMLSGRTIPVHIESVEEISDVELQVRGKIRFDEFFENHEMVQRGVRKKGSSGASGGSWMVATRYNRGTLESEVTRPHEIESGVQAIIDDLDLENGWITFTALGYGGNASSFLRSHDRWVTDPKYETEENDYLCLRSNEKVLLDPQTDDITANRELAALEYPDENQLHSLLEGIRDGDRPAPTTNCWSTERLEEFADWVGDTIGPDSLPSQEQATFVTRADSQLVGLQGPPGTGKTAGTLAPAICGRAHAAATAGQNASILVTAPSNTAIYELLETVAEQIEASQTHPELDVSMESVQLVRIASERPADSPTNVEYLDYNDDSDTKRLNELATDILGTGSPTAAGQATGNSNEASTTPSPGQSSGQAQLGDYGAADDASSGEGTQTIVFATAGRAWRLVKEFLGTTSNKKVAGCSCWDCLFIDEASMMTMPEFLLAGANLTADAQVLVGGDHRQLPPVQQHDWEEETHRDIRATAPYLSALNYLRLLRGEPVLPEEYQDDWIQDREPETVQIPFDQLSETHRFGQPTADLMWDTIYEQDGISYTAGSETDRIDLADQLPGLLGAVYDGSPISVITYQPNGDYQQWNPIETLLATALTRVLPDHLSAGVTTPHNAQRSQVQSALVDAHARQTGETITADKLEQAVETVNRFQGGENDVMVVSATVADPQYISRESDFLLSQSRLNVSLTRHKQKLIVLVPQSLLGYIPPDVDQYDNAQIWKLLAQASGEAPVGTDTTPTWSGTVGDIAGNKLATYGLIDEAEATLEHYPIWGADLPRSSLDD